MKFSFFKYYCLVLSFLFIFRVHATPVKHLRVLMHENPATEVSIAWSVSNSRSKAPAKIYLSNESYEGNLSKYTQVIDIKHDQVIDGEDDRLIYSKVNNLLPSTKYFFVAQYGDDKTREFHFITAPANNLSNFKLLFGGDSRSHRDSRQKMNKEMKSLFKKILELWP